MANSDLIYVFTSEDGIHCALARAWDGSNLPGTIQWIPHDEILMTLSAIKTYVARPDVAFMNLATRAYHIEKRTAQVPCFPKAHRSSA
jgi:hypothetical protein